MTKQNKGFPIIASKNLSIRASERLVAFLNVDVDDKEEIKKFCQKYHFIPPGHIKDRFENFKKEQVELREIAEKVYNRELTEEDLTKINQRLSGISPMVHFMKKKNIKTVNEKLRDEADRKSYSGYFEAVFDWPTGENDFLVISQHHKNSWASLWWSLMRYLIRLTSIRHCKNCGQFFIPARKNNQKFCSYDCRNKYNSTKRYHEIKKKKTSG